MIVLRFWLWSMSLILLGSFALQWILARGSMFGCWAFGVALGVNVVATVPYFFAPPVEKP